MLIGPNGSGKSTILRAIANCAECRRTEDGATEYILLDTEATDMQFEVARCRPLLDDEFFEVLNKQIGGCW